MKLFNRSALVVLGLSAASFFLSQTFASQPRGNDLPYIGPMLNSSLSPEQEVRTEAPENNDLSTEHSPLSTNLSAAERTEQIKLDKTAESENYLGELLTEKSQLSADQIEDLLDELQLVEMVEAVVAWQAVAREKHAAKLEEKKGFDHS